MTQTTVFITGAGRGIGRACAEAFAAQGALVGVNDINPDSCAATVDAILAAGGQAIACEGDVAHKLSIQSTLYTFLEQVGRLDVLVNNAAVEPSGAIVSFDEFDWNRTLDVNLKGAFFCLQWAARVMSEQGQGGSIINLTTSLTQAPASLNRAAFLASKAGLLGLTQAAAQELAPYRIRVNAVAPGLVDTPSAAYRVPAEVRQAMQVQQPNGLGSVAQVADAVLFLASPAAQAITGQCLQVAHF
jgi:3-oxoacyl-[acyl-carrier protein] reductase